MRLIDLIPIHREIPGDLRSAIILEWDKTSIDRIRTSSWLGFVLYALLLFVDLAREASHSELYDQLAYRVLSIIHFSGILFLPLGVATSLFHNRIKNSEFWRPIVIYAFLAVMIIAVFSNAVLSMHVSGSAILYVGFILMANWTLSMNVQQRIVFNLISLSLMLYFIIFPVEAIQTYEIGEDVRVFRLLRGFEVTFLTIIAFVFSLFDEGYRLLNFRARHELASDKAKLERSERIKSHLFANVAHDFRSPLTVISGLTRQMIDTDSGETPIRLEMIDRNADRMLDLVEQILALSKLDEGKFEVHLEHMDIVAFLRYVEDSFRGSAASRDIEFALEVPFVSLYHDIDKELMFKVLSNLLSNAFKYTQPGGKVTLGLRVDARDSGTSLEIYVKDTGSGIHPNDLPFIFERFYRSSAQSFDTGGTGIGLSMVQEIVAMLDGEIQVNSTLGTGSEFIVRFKTVSENETDASSVKPGVLHDVVDPAQVDPEAHTLSHLERSTVLVIEDNRDVGDLISSTLWPEYHVLRAFDGQQGELIARDLLPDLILTDIRMPKRDGLDLCRSVKSSELTSHIPVIVLTGVIDESVRIQALDAGAIDVLSKPFKEEELKGKIKSVLALRDSLQAKLREGALEGKTEPESIEHAFITKVRDSISKHLQNPEYRVTDLCRSVGMSRTQLHNKLKALTGRSTTAFIKEMRLTEACKLLNDGNLNVSEVAYEVGFADPAYFSRVFANTYGMPPSQFGGQSAVSG